jgi:hypothetical protein
MLLSPAQIEDLQTLASYGATQQEMASYLGISVDTLGRRMKDQPEVFMALQQAGARTKASLRRKQISVALNDAHPGQSTMLVWLGKTMLGQSDKISLKIETADDALRALCEVWPELDEDEILRQLSEPIEAEAEEVGGGEAGHGGVQGESPHGGDQELEDPQGELGSEGQEPDQQ